MPLDLFSIATAIHFAALGVLALYGIHRLWLLGCWRRLLSDAADASPPLPDHLPTVTVQLPIFNERFVAKRVIDAAARLDWPPERLEIQVLDDSTDDTSELAGERVAYWHGRGVRIRHLRREHRQGFKAGALAEGLRRASGELVAIFDADFTPARDFLRQTVPHFRDPNVGMVQTRWGFSNAEHSLLTGVQALLLGPHFRIEHQVRFRRGLFFNFNGTAGIWRREAIDSAGGWRADTVTEDLDLSYRAQLAGWRFVYLDHYEVPSELPVSLGAFRGQQQRWAKGSVQTARKILPQLLRRRLPTTVKAEALAHLLANLCWLLGTVLFLTLYPTIVSRVGIGPWQIVRVDLPLFLATSCAILTFFLTYLIATGHKKGAFRHFLLLPMLSIGLAPSIAVAVVQGLWSDGGFFTRTPKFGIVGTRSLPQQAFLYRQPGLTYLFLNAALFLYSLLPLAFAWQRGTWYSLPLFALFPGGFLTVMFLELSELYDRLRAPSHPARKDPSSAWTTP